MKKLLILSFCFSVTSHSMELPHDPLSDSLEYNLNLILESTDQEESGSWHPWDNTALTSVVHYAKAQDFLRGIEKTYQTIREGAFEEPDFFNKEYLVQTSTEHVTCLKRIIKLFGWPTKKRFDSKCTKGAWLIAQHANHDLSFQEEALQYLSKLSNKSALQHYAYLLDRILVNKSESQHFGTLADKHGQLFPINGYHPNPSNPAETELQLEVVNRRRKSVGFTCLQDELAKLSHFFNMQQRINELRNSQPTESSQ